MALLGFGKENRLDCQLYTRAYSLLFSVKAKKKKKKKIDLNTLNKFCISEFKSLDAILSQFLNFLHYPSSEYAQPQNYSY